MHLKKYKKTAVKKSRGVLVVLVSGLFSLISPFLHGQDTGFKYFKNYSYIEYDHHPQNWGMVQARNGIIYVANNAGVLEFDGVSWRVIYVPNYTARSIAIDEAGTIYIGGIDEIGYLAPDDKGTLGYKSLRNYLPENQKKFSEVWKTYAIGKNVYFDTSTFLFRWDSGQRKLVGVPRDYRAFFICGRELFIRKAETGFERIVQMESDGLKTVPLAGDETFAGKRVYTIFPYNNRDLFIGTCQDGLYIHDGKTTTHFPTEVDDYLKEKGLFHGIRLTSGDFALATLFGGLVIIDPYGHQKYMFNKTSGLQDDKVYYIFEDNRENLWLCLDKGISKIEYTSPISFYDERSNLSGIVVSVVKHHNNLYVGTNNGLYYLESSSKFSLIKGVSGGCWDLLSMGDLLLAATSGGGIHIRNNIKQNVIKSPSYALSASKHQPGRIWCGTSNGLVVLSRQNDQWIEEHRFDSDNQPIRSIAEDQQGNAWLGTLSGGAFKIDFGVDINDAKVSQYDTSNGLPDGEIYVAMAAGHVMFATKTGLFRFDEQNNKFIPDKTLGDDFAGGGGPVFRLVEDKNKNIWFHSKSRNYQAVPGPGESFTIHSIALRRIPITIQVNAIYPDPDGKIVWFASVAGLVHYDTTVKKNYRQDFQTFVRAVLANEKLIFGGYKNKTGKATKDIHPILEYKDRNLQFEFAAPFFEAETDTLYQCFMEGYDDGWSAWDKNTKRNYTNLDAGLYTFKVRSKNIYEHPGSEDVFQFKILLPWYRTWWAFLSYALVFFILTYLIFKWQRSIKLEKEKKRLEQIVEERTKEINEKTHQLEAQTIQLKDQSEKLQEMDKVKSRFFANISHEFRTPLTLIMSPLEQMIFDSRDKKQKEELNVMLRSSQHLLTLINQLLDLSRLDSGKMKLQTAHQNIIPFIKGTLASFHMLAQHNRLNLEFHSEEEDISLYFDAQKMEEVMYNLLSNAFKFTPHGGKITIFVSKEEGEPPGFVKISVQDTGIGIPKEQLPHIFDRFFQAQSFKEKGRKGTGIGLALAKEIVVLHHGKIDVHSQEEKGTEFVILLPMGHEHLKPGEIVPSPEAAPEPRKNRDVEPFYMITGEEDECEAPEQGEEETESVDTEKNVILVVEDHADVRKYIRGPLEPEYTVVEACDGKEGITKAKDIIPDLIVSDIMMPEVDGYELCRDLKTDVKTSHIPIVLLTAKASEDSIIEGLETGADDYITKPFNTKILLTRIKNLIELRRQLQLKIQREKMLLPAEIAVSSVDKEFFKEFQQVIEKNLSDPDFNIDVLCAKLYMSRSTLFRKIQALTGETPNLFIQSYRLERGAQLLRRNYGNVTEVAMAVGFSTPQYFAKCFKEKFHQSPSSYQASESSVNSKESKK